MKVDLPIVETAKGASLRAASLSFTQSLGQTVGGMAPSGGLAVVIPLVFVKAADASVLMFVPMLVGFLLLAVVFRVFATRQASAGGLGSFGGLAFGRSGDILFSWAYIITMGITVASGAPVAVYYVDVLIHQISGTTPTGWCNGLLLVLTVAVAVWIAYRGIKLSTDLMLVIECLSLGTMVVLVLWALAREPRWLDHAQLRWPGWQGANFRLAFVLGFTSLAGFETVTALGEEAQHATRAIPQVIICCIAPIGLLYLAMTYSLVLLFHHSRVGLGQTDAPFQVLAGSLGLPWLGVCVSLGVFLSFFAMVLGCLNAGARILYALARKGEFWPRYGRAHPIHRSPVLAILLLAGFSLIVPLIVLGTGTTMEDCIAYTTQLASIAYITSYILVALAAPVFLCRIGVFKMSYFFASGAALAILGIVAFINLYPVPTWPWNALPYEFAAAVLVGIAVSVVFRATANKAVDLSDHEPITGEL